MPIISLKLDMNKSVLIQDFIEYPIVSSSLDDQKKTSRLTILSLLAI